MRWPRVLVFTTTAILLGTVVSAQPTADTQAVKPAPAQSASRAPGQTLMVEVTISRYQDGKRISSAPFTITVLPENTRSTLRVGGQVPIPSTTFTPSKEGEKTQAPLTSYSYRDIGTNIDVSATDVGDGAYRIGVIVEETSLYPSTDKSINLVAGAPAFRSFRSSNAATLRDGQSIEYIAATDRIDGQVARIGVKLIVPK